MKHLREPDPSGVSLFVIGLVWLCTPIFTCAALQEQHQDVRKAFDEAEQALVSGNYSVAARGFLKIIELDPNSAPAYNNLGLAYKHMRQTDDAINAFETAKRLDPN